MVSATGHELVSGIVYGPVFSRRFGKTLGLNLLPSATKYCNFSCPYCQLGLTHQKTAVELACPTVAEVAQAVHHWLQTNGYKDLQAMVISGNGEPTLHPNFSDVIERLLQIRQVLAPGLPIFCFTNGTRLTDLHVCKALSRLDQCHLKIDPGRRQSNVPSETEDWDVVVAHARALPNLHVQSCVFAGRISNTDKESLDGFLQALLTVPARTVTLYTVSRDTAISDILPVAAEQLESLAARARAVVSCPVHVV